MLTFNSLHAFFYQSFFVLLLLIFKFLEVELTSEIKTTAALQDFQRSLSFFSYRITFIPINQIINA